MRIRPLRSGALGTRDQKCHSIWKVGAFVSIPGFSTPLAKAWLPNLLRQYS